MNKYSRGLVKTEFSFLTYFLCYIGLIILLVLTIIATNLHLGKLSYIFAFIIATIKALVILIFFMHAKTRRFFFIIGGYLIFSLSILLLTLADFLFRMGKGH